MSRVADFDANGCELDSGQRWCIDHGLDAAVLPRSTLLRLVS